MFTSEEVAAHDTEDDCWLVIEGYVYDVTAFLRSHPGGIAIVLVSTHCCLCCCGHSVEHEGEVSCNRHPANLVRAPWNIQEGRAGQLGIVKLRQLCSVVQSYWQNRNQNFLIKQYTVLWSQALI